jgi:hypothetical protein
MTWKINRASNTPSAVCYASRRRGLPAVVHSENNSACVPARTKITWPALPLSSTE